MAAMGVTQHLISRTTRLRALARSVDPFTVAAIVALLIVVVSIELQSAARPAQREAIIVIATPTLGVVHEKVGASGVARLRTSVEQQIAQPTAAPVEQPIEVLSVVAPQPTAAPVAPTVVPTTEAHWSDDTFVVTGDSVPTVAPAMQGQPGYNGWTCGQQYGDWRDSDPMYVHAECYAKP